MLPWISIIYSTDKPLSSLLFLSLLLVMTPSCGVKEHLRHRSFVIVFSRYPSLSKLLAFCGPTPGGWEREAGKGIRRMDTWSKSSPATNYFLANQLYRVILSYPFCKMDTIIISL